MAGGATAVDSGGLICEHMRPPQRGPPRPLHLIPERRRRSGNLDENAAPGLVVGSRPRASQHVGAEAMQLLNPECRPWISEPLTP